MKKMKLSTIVLAALIAVIPMTQAKADPAPGYYVGLGAILNDTLDANAHFPNNQNIVDYNLGWGVEGSAGYEFKSGFRLEGEVAHIRAGVDKLTNGGTGGSGTLADTDIFANAFYDFKTGTMFTPYIGGGLGMSMSDADNMGTLGNGKAMNDEQIVFVYQAIVGASAQIAPQWALTADYRYIATSNPRFSTTGGGNATLDNQSHNIVVGVRYSFNKPEPPLVPQEVAAPVVPMPAPAQPAVAAIPESYMVFFDFDKSDLTPEATRILSSAAQEYKRGGYVKITVTAHTDTMGTNKYNMALSERRAASVKAELLKLGVPESGLTTSAVGKAGQLVPTADQVREAQNRRAEIVFSKQ